MKQRATKGTLSEQALEDGFKDLEELEGITGHTRQCLYNFKIPTYENKQGTTSQKYECLRAGAILLKLVSLTKSKVAKKDITIFGKKYTISVKLWGEKK